MTEIKLTEKEEKAVASVVSFFQGLKDCPKDEKEKYIIENAFVVRNIIAFKKLEPKNTYALLSSTIIHNIIPYLIAKDDEKISDVAERIDNQTNDMLKNLVEELKKENIDKKTE